VLGQVVRHIIHVPLRDINSEYALNAKEQYQSAALRHGCSQSIYRPAIDRSADLFALPQYDFQQISYSEIAGCSWVDLIRMHKIFLLRNKNASGWSQPCPSTFYDEKLAVTAVQV
jgi:hypothetical protein